MSSRRRLAALVLLIATQTAFGDGVLARQGLRSEDIDAVEQTVFSSPMILEMSFPSNAVKASGHEVPPPGLGRVGRFSCDGVSIMTLGFKGPEPSEPPNRLHFRYVIRVSKGQDKLVSVRVRIFSSGQLLLDLVDRNFKVEEEGAKVRSISGTFSGDYPNEPAELQVTITAKNK